VGTAAGMIGERNLRNIRDLPIAVLRGRLKEQGAVVDGTH
jgi:hypothetical protein